MRHLPRAPRIGQPGLVVSLQSKVGEANPSRLLSSLKQNFVHHQYPFLLFFATDSILFTRRSLGPTLTLWVLVKGELEILHSTDRWKLTRGSSPPGQLSMCLLKEKVKGQKRSEGAVLPSLTRGLESPSKEEKNQEGEKNILFPSNYPHSPPTSVFQIVSSFYISTFC